MGERVGDTLHPHAAIAILNYGDGDARRNNFGKGVQYAGTDTLVVVVAEWDKVG